MTKDKATAKSIKPKEGTVTIHKTNAFADAANVLGAGVDSLFNDNGVQYSLVPLDMIEVSVQIREVFEDEENTLQELAESIKVRGLLQPILLRPSATGYLLIAGERRYRATRLAGLEEIPAYIRDMTDDEAEDAQLAENIHRKNLTQIEEAKKIQRDLDRLGSIDEVLVKHQKSRAWLSKMLSLLTLPEQAKRLVTENVSADLEIINTVKTIEKINPAKAKELVDDLRNSRGKVNARDLAGSIKEQVKPSRKRQEPKTREQEYSGAPRSEDNATLNVGKSAPSSVAQALSDAYVSIFERGYSPQMALFDMGAEAAGNVGTWLNRFYRDGKKNDELSRTVIQGLRNGRFCSDGDSAFALIAFLKGATGDKFDVLDILSAVAK
ncbi:MAG: ParB/RepB/Spo0J family partition protein [Nitrosospira sp.]|nr:ParB/RepB/Spo0J family partition protein [Nitrosospira sp.]